MSTSATQAPAIPSTARIVGFDVARCLALVGMMLTHVLDPGTPILQLTSGRSSALFAVLAGVSLALMSGRTTPVTGAARGLLRRRIAVRAVVVSLIGLVLGGLDSGVAVILVVYGVLFLLALPFLGLRARALAAWGIGWILLSPVAMMALLPVLPETTYRVPGPMSIADPVALVSELLVTGYYPAIVWLGYVLVGMALGRIDLLDVGRQILLLATGLLLAALGFLLSGLVLGSPGIRDRLSENYDRPPPWGRGGLESVLQAGLYGTPPRDGSWWWLGVWAPHSSTIADKLHTTGTALAVIAVCLLLTSWFGAGVRRAWTILAGAGAIPLTAYTIHVVMVSVHNRDPDLLGLSLQLPIVLGLGAVLAALRLRGPLESALTAITRGVVPDRDPPPPTDAAR